MSLNPQAIRVSQDVSWMVHEANLPVIAIVSQSHLWANVADLPVEQEDAAIVADATVSDRHANITDNAVCQVPLQKLLNALPTVVHCVLFIEVVLTAVTRQLQFRPNLPSMPPASSRNAQNTTSFLLRQGVSLLKSQHHLAAYALDSPVQNQ